MCPAPRRITAEQIAPDPARLREVARDAVSQRLAQLLADHPRSLAQLSEETGLGESTVGRIARGATEPSLSEMLALAAVFDLGSVDLLVGTTGTQDALSKASRPGPPAQGKAS